MAEEWWKYRAGSSLAFLIRKFSSLRRRNSFSTEDNYVMAVSVKVTVFYHEDGAAVFSETSVNFYRVTRCHIPEDSTQRNFIISFKQFACTAAIVGCTDATVTWVEEAASKVKRKSCSLTSHS
jgi:hypothetical protein